MYSLLFPLLFVFAAAEPPAALRPAGKEVVIQDREILIPHVPESVEQAHAEYSKVRPTIANGIKDLEKEIMQLLEIDRKNEGILVSVRVRSSEAEAARFYSKMLTDDQYAKLQKTAISAWNEWQSVLLDAGLATSDVPLYRKSDKSKNDDSNTKLRLSRQKKMSDAFLESERELNIDLATNPNSGEFDPKAFRFLMEESTTFENRVSTSTRLKIVANQQAPQLARSWNPLVDYLNTCAANLANLDSPSTPYLSEDLIRLQRQAKIKFLERFRSTLWLSGVVWARMTSTAPPAPLQKLNVVANEVVQP